VIDSRLTARQETTGSRGLKCWLAVALQSPNWTSEIALLDARRKSPKIREAPTKREIARMKKEERGPTLKDRAVALAREEIASGADFKAIGISRHYLSRMCALGFLIKIGRMQYCAPERKAA
jgi:hypothetical protein